MGFALIISMIIATSGVISGFSTEIFGITERAGESPSLFIQPTGSDDGIPSNILSLINHTNIMDILPIVEQEVSFISDIGSFKSNLVGINTSKLLNYFSKSRIYAGRLPFTNASNYECIVGKNIDQRIGSIGLNVSNNFSNNNNHLDVVGLIQDVKEFQNAVIVELATYNKIFNLTDKENSFQRIKIRLKNGNFIDETISDLEILLQDYTQNLILRPEQQAAVFTERLFSDIISKLNLMFFVLFIIALIRIFHTISWFVKKYERDLLIMRAMGLSSSQVVIIVFLISAIIGNLGFLVGFIFGFSIPPMIFVLLTLYLGGGFIVPNYTISSLFALFAFSNLIAAVAAVYPAIVIASKPPSALTLATHDMDR
jgi:ABC-type lipoprotein release transport system permease subunit